jgi:hypothetical protein
MFVCLDRGRVILRIRSESRQSQIYKRGQNIAIKILSKEAQGYEVLIQKDNIRAYLKTPDKLKIGDEILAVFVCFRSGRAQLTRLFSPPRALKPVAEVKSFERKAATAKKKTSKDSE